MSFQEETETGCPYCGEAIILLLDPSVPRQTYIEDCEVCCRPIEINVEVHDRESIRVEVKREDE